MQIKRAFSWSRVIRYQNIPSRTSYHIITKDRKLALQLTEIEVFNQEVDHLFKNGFERIDCTEKSIRIFKFDYRLEDLNVDFIFNYLEHLVKIREALFPK